MLNELQTSLRTVSSMRVLEETRGARALEELTAAETRYNTLREAADLCSRCLQEQSDVRPYLEAQVTALLRRIKGYEFRFDPVFKSDDVSLKGLKPVIVEDGVADDPRNYGDGVQNILAFAIRLILLLFSKRRAKVMVLDEPWLNLNAKLWPYMIDFIQDLQRHFDVQIVVITHSGVVFPDMYRVVKTGKTSVVERSSNG